LEFVTPRQDRDAVLRGQYPPVLKGVSRPVAAVELVSAASDSALHPPPIRGIVLSTRNNNDSQLTGRRFKIVW